MNRIAPQKSAVALAILALSLSACVASSPEPEATAVEGGVLVIAEASDTTELDPQTSLYDNSWRLQDLVYDSLVTTDEQSAILPSLAESWTDEGDAYEFSIRQDAAFSNGRAVTADDVVGTLNRMLDPATGSYWAPQLGPVTSITALDEFTVRVELETPWAPFLPALASVSAAILPIAELDSGEFDPAVDMLGSGPFQLKSHVQDQEWSFVANPEYWGAETLALDGVTVRIVPDDAARVGALRDGSTDIAFFANPDAPTLLAAIPNVTSTVQSSSDMYWLLLNTVAPDSPFTDQTRRQALATTLDRDALVQTALGGAGEATAIAAPGLPGSCTIDSLPTYESSAESASALLDEQGVEGGSFSLMSPPYLSSFDPIAQLIQQQANDGSFDVTIETPEVGAYIERVYIQNPGDFDAVIDYFAGYLYPTMAIQNVVVDPAVPTAFSGFASEVPGLEDVLLTANTSMDAAERQSATQTACEMVAEFANVIPLATKSTTIGVRADLVDAEIPSFDGYDIYLRNLVEFSKLG